MKAYRNEFPIEKMASILGVSRSGYYKYLKKGVSRRERENIELSLRIKESYIRSRKTYGSPRILEDLKDMGIKCSKNRVAGLMKKMNLVSIRHKKFKVVTTDSDHDLPVSPNLLWRDFSASEPNEVWVSDITYINTEEGWLYLCLILDLYSRRIVGWSMKGHMMASLVTGALEMAYKARSPEPGLVFHSDRGSQYASTEFRDKLEEYTFFQSMSRRGNCWDNACAESVFGTIKTELVYNRKYRTRAEARRDIFEYIEVFYNRTRRHSTIGNVSPVIFERRECA